MFYFILLLFILFLFNRNYINKKSILSIIIISSLLFSACGSTIILPDEDTEINTTNSSTPSEAISDTTSELKIHFLDVGQADCILVTNNNYNMLVDAGNNGDADFVVDYLEQNNIQNLDYVIGTHPHEDHIGGLDVVINTFEVKNVYLPKVTHTTKTFKDLISSIQNKGLKITTPIPGDTFNLGDSVIQILAPNNSSYDELNNYSIVLKITHGANKILLMGDAESLSEQEILDKGFDVSADLLKVGHHGSSSSTSTNFLEIVNPKYAVICVGSDNDYGHPHKETLEKFKNIKTYRTDKDGTIIATSNGKTITFSK